MESSREHAWLSQQDTIWERKKRFDSQERKRKKRIREKDCSRRNYLGTPKHYGQVSHRAEPYSVSLFPSCQAERRTAATKLSSRATSYPDTPWDAINAQPPGRVSTEFPLFLGEVHAVHRLGASICSDGHARFSLRTSRSGVEAAFVWCNLAPLVILKVGDHWGHIHFAHWYQLVIHFCLRYNQDNSCLARILKQTTNAT